MRRTNLIGLFCSILVFSIVSCVSKTTPKQAASFENASCTIETTAISDSTYLFKFGGGILVHWNRNEQSFVKDSLFLKAVEYFGSNLKSLTEQLTCTQKTSLRLCNDSSSLVTGDIAFLLVDEIVKLPYFKVFGVQWDFLERGCKYPAGMFEYFKTHREEVKLKVESYVLNRGL